MAGPLGKNGVLYGTTSAGGTTTGCGYFGCGAAYELTPPTSPGGAWTETTLYGFMGGTNGSAPSTGLVSGAGGTLYGWCQGGESGTGMVFVLTTPASPGGDWTETRIYSFQGPPTDGGIPVGGLAMGPNGSLYGTTMYGGTYDQGSVFELTPPTSLDLPWALTVLYSFRGDGDGTYPGAGVVVNREGVIFGTTAQGGALGLGTVFAVELVSGAWKERVLSSLTSGIDYPNGLALGQKGVLYGQTEDDGIFEVLPPAASGEAWTAQPLWASHVEMSAQSVAVGPTGTIYWTTLTGGTSTACGVGNGCGTLNELIPPASPGGAWTPVVLHNFTGQHGDGYQPNGGLVVTQDGRVYGTAYYGGKNFFGTVFTYQP